MKKNIFSILLLVTLSVTYWFIGEDIIRRLSATYDEAVYLAAGYSYWRVQDFRLNNQDHPPLAKLLVSFPLLFSNVYFPGFHPAWLDGRQYAFGDIFLYHNRLPAEIILSRGRRMMLFLSLLGSFLLFFWIFQLSTSYFASFLGVLFYLFSPTILAMSTLATTDLPLMVFYFMTIYFCWKYWQNPTVSNSIFFGIALGLAMVSKHSGVVLWLVVGVISLAETIRRKKFSFVHLLLVIFFSGLIIYLVYFGQEPFKNYLIGLRDLFSKVSQGRSSFFLGRHSPAGWRSYFLVAFFLKTPLPFLGFIVFLLFFYRRVFSWMSWWYLIWPALIYFLVASFSKMQIGFRHILPVFPFLFVLTGLNFKLFWRKNIIVKLLLLILLMGYVREPFRYHPYEISYFNQLIKKGSEWNYFTDSSLDWGQGLKELSNFLKQQGNPVIYFCYFGTADPNYYGIKYIPFGFITNVEHRPPDLSAEEKSSARFLVISATNFMATYYADKNVFEWLKKISPDKVLADSLLVYDFARNPEIRQMLRDKFGI